MHLQVLIGRDRGQVYPIAPGTYVLGREADTTLVLSSDLVSRHHASLVVGANEIRVTDLDSSNGTYVNGARVLGDGVVALGDILVVGDFVMRVHGKTVPALANVPPPRVDLPPAAGGAGIGAPPGISGNLLEVPTATLLRYLVVVKRTCILELTSPPLRSSIEFSRGHIGEVVVDSRKTRDPMQALTAILRWKGTFNVAPAGESSSTLLLGLDSLLPPVGTGARPSMFPQH